MSIQKDSKVTLHFSLALTSGDVVDSNFEQDPATFVMGDGSLLPGFEEALLGKFKGETVHIDLPPAKAFGMANPQNIQHFKRHQFGADMVLEPGLVVSFADPSGELPGVISKLDGDWVEVDFNHPLAGKVIQFSAKIIDVQ